MQPIHSVGPDDVIFIDVVPFEDAIYVAFYYVVVIFVFWKIPETVIFSNV